MVTTNYPVGDFLIQVKNAAMARNKEIRVPATKQVVAVAQALKKLEYLDDVKKEGSFLKVSISFRDKKPVVMKLKLVSKPGLRIYMGVGEIEKKRGPSVYLISTPKGIISSKTAVKDRTGGEVIAEIT